MRQFIIFSALFVGAFSQCTLGPYGGGGGSSWTHQANYDAYGEVTGMNLRAGNRIDQMDVFYGGNSAGAVGGSGGSAYDFRLQAGEYINRVQLRAGTNIDQLIFHTTLNNQFGAYGGGGGDSYTVSGDRLLYFTGRADDRIDQLTFYFGTCYYDDRPKN